MVRGLRDGEREVQEDGSCVETEKAVESESNSERACR